jgi:hypothetical protein
MVHEKIAASALKKRATSVALFFALKTETLHADLTTHFTPRPSLTIGSCLSIDIKPEVKQMDTGTKLTKSTPLPRSYG